MEEKEFIIKESLANAILQYLAAKPFSEVFKIISELQNIKPIEKKED